MGVFFDSIPPNVLEWVKEQAMFWVGTAPLSPDGKISVSPKGTHQTFFHIEPNKLIWEDLSGSGIETIAHIRENKRVTILFNAFEGPPRCCRIYGTATYHEYGTPEYDQWLPSEKRQSGSRAIIIVNIFKVSTSCGFGVPLYQYIGDRPTLQNWSCNLEKPEAPPGKRLQDYWNRKCATSLNGLPGLSTALETVGKPFKNRWIKPDDRRKMANDNSMEVVRKMKTFSFAPGAQQAAKNHGTFLDDKLFVGLIGGLLISALLNYSGITLA